MPPETAVCINALASPADSASQAMQHWGELMVLPNADEPDDFDPHEWPFFWMTQAVGRYLQKLERGLKKAGLDVSRWRVLMCVNDKKISVGEIAELAIVKLPTMMKIIQRMEAEGMVLCQTRPSDGRFTDVSLTENGRAARRTAWKIANDIYTGSFKGISARDQQFLNHLLEAVFHRLDD